MAQSEHTTKRDQPFHMAVLWAEDDPTKKSSSLAFEAEISLELFLSPRTVISHVERGKRNKYSLKDTTLCVYFFESETSGHISRFGEVYW